MVNTVYNALESLKFNFQTIVEKPNQKVFRLGMQLENGRTDCFIDIRIPDKQVLISSVCPVSIPENKRKQISEFITRANTNLILGAFEMDFNDGQLKYKNNFIYDDTFPHSEDVFIRNLLITYRMLDKYIPGIMSVLYANLEPRAAIAQIENITEPSFN